MFWIIIICLMLFCLALWLFPRRGDETTQAPHDIGNIVREIDQIQVKRDPPEVARLKELVGEFRNNNWDVLIAAGDIYRKGAYPRWLPDPDTAAKLFKIAAMCPDGQIAGIAQTKYIEIYDVIDEMDAAGQKLPVDPGLELCKLAEKAIQTTPWSSFATPKGATKAYGGELATAAPDMQFDFVNFEENTAPPILYKSDAQNVHDHSVTKITNFNIHRLKESPVVENFEEEIRDAILTHKDLDAATKEQALHVMDSLGEKTHSQFGVSEKEALGKVWKKVVDSEYANNLTETLAKQLACSVEHGHIVCSSGKISRIMATLDGVGNEMARPVWALRDEIAATAARIRDQVTSELGDTPAAGRKMREAFSRAVFGEYVERLGMSKKIIEPLIAEYEAGF